MRSPVAIALSGGVDSLVAGALLKESGRDVVGFHFLTGFEIHAQGSPHSSRTAGEASAPGQATAGIASVANQLGIPLHIVDLRTEFRAQVVDYFTQSYLAGRTPNPCLVCNPAIKFGILFEEAQKHGAGAMATGHYARVVEGPDGRRRLLRGIDPAKDQSYFLARLTRAQLRNVTFPLGGLTKDQTRQLAHDKGLVPSVSQESQDICFIKEGAYADFLKSQPGFSAAPGPIVNLMGETIGRHSGLHLFTIGQRRGINCPAAQPYYVVRIDTVNNRLVVGQKKDLLSRRCRVQDINWITATTPAALNVQVRVRYRHVPVPARLTPTGDTGATIEFDEPQSAVTPGQGAVFYDGDEVLGGGWIR